MRRTTRREALISATAALLAAGCGASSSGAPSSAVLGSTLHSTWIDPDGTGALSPGPGEPFVPRTELASRSPASRVLATLAHVTDAHVLDAASPARVPFLDRLGPPFQSTFRPQETLTAQVLGGAVNAIRTLHPDAVIQGGDLIDNDQANELARALAVLNGGTVRFEPYVGVQSPQNADPFYYRPDLDAPRHPGLLRAATRPFTSAGLRQPVLPVLGDHDILVAGEIPPDPTTHGLAVGNQALWELPPGLTVPPGAQFTANGSPDGPPVAGLVNQFLAEALNGAKVTVPARAQRRELTAAEVTARLRRGATTLDYVHDVGPAVRVIVLDLARRAGGSGGLVRPDQPGWLASQLEAAGNRHVLVVSHQPLGSSEGGDQLLAVLDRHPRVLAALSGHTHRNRIVPRPTSAGGYWLIQTASLIDYPQQARALRIVETANQRVAIQTWMLDHVTDTHLGPISRQLAYLDAQGGRPGGFAGTHQDRNAILYTSSV